MKRLLLIGLVMAAILLFLLASAGANTSIFAKHYHWLLAANAVLAVGMAVLVGVQLRSLWVEYKQRQFGSRLKLKLLGMFVLLSVVPGAVIYGLSVQFAVQSIESWYNVQVDTALQDSLGLGRSALDALLDQLADRTHEAALELGDSAKPTSVPALIRLRERLDVDTILVLSSSGRVQASAGEMPNGFVPATPAGSELRRARQSGGLRVVDSEGGVLTFRVVQPIVSRAFVADPPLLQVSTRVPAALARSAEAIQTLNQQYQELVLARQGLKRIYLITLTLALLLAMFAAVAVAFVFAREFSAPLSILAEGTQAVAAGDFSPRQALPARDELGVLTQSFNRMTQQLQEARGQAEKNRSAVDTARAYLESVLTNLSSGVLAFSVDGHLRAANRGAATVLSDELEGFERIALDNWPDHAVFRDAILSGFAENEDDWHRQIEIDKGEGRIQTLSLAGSRLPATAGGGGFVVVFDDVSQLISAQRNEAWAEVAKRLAHEIKNPLTPIQLAAERLEHRLAGKLGEDDRNLLARSTQTIVNQVESMKNLVNSFRDYARLPSPKLNALDLNALVRDVMVLYEGAKVRIAAELQADLPQVQGDASQLRQVIHNLFQNAQDAVAELGEGGEITIITRREGKRIELHLRDNGPGFPSATLTRAFEPYVTNKPRGSGLGLAIVKKIIEEHRGDITLANHAEGGAEVRVRLRLAELG